MAWYVIETPLAQPPLVEPGGAVDISARITSDTTISVNVAIAILDGTTLLQERTWDGTLYAGVPQTVLLTFTAADTGNPYRNVRVRVTDEFGTVEQIFYNIFEVGAGMPEATVTEPVASPQQVYVDQPVLVSSLIQVTHPGTYTVVINIYEGSFWGGLGRFMWGKSQQVTFGASAKTVSVSNPAMTYDGDNGRRDVEVIVYSGATEIFKQDWDDIYSVSEPPYDFEMMDGYPLADPKYVPVDSNVQITARVRPTYSDDYRFVFYLYEEALVGHGELLYPPIEVNISLDSGQWQDVTFTHLCTMPAVGTTGVDVHIDVYAHGYKIWEDEYGRVFDIGTAPGIDFEMMDGYPVTTPKYVQVGDEVEIASRLKTTVAGEYRLSFILYEESLTGHGEQLYPPIELIVNFNAAEWTDVVFTHACTMPPTGPTGVDIHLDIYDVNDNLVWEDEYGRPFDIVGEAPQCQVDSDCPPGYECEDGYCVPVGNGNGVPEEGKFPLAAGLMIAGGVALIISSGKKKE